VGWQDITITGGNPQGMTGYAEMWQKVIESKEGMFHSQFNNIVNRDI